MFGVAGLSQIAKSAFDGIHVIRPESADGSASYSEIHRKPANPLEKDYCILDPPFALRVDHGKLIFEDDGLEFETM